jgi:hypothetical protein
MLPDQARPAPNAQAFGAAAEVGPGRNAEVRQKRRHDGTHVLGEDVWHHSHACLLTYPGANQPVQVQQLEGTSVCICDHVHI